MAISVNKVYRTVLSIMNKEGRGFLTPDQFNRIGREVQLDLLERAFFDYNKALNRKKGSATNDEYGNIPKNIKEKIDIFSKETELLIPGINSIRPGINVRVRSSIVGVSVPTQITAGTYSNVATTGGSGSGLTVTVYSSGGNWDSITTVAGGSGYAVGDVITIPQASITGSNNPYTFPIEATDLNVYGSALLPTDLYRIISLSRSSRSVNLEELNKSEYTYVNSSKLTTPSEIYPVYYRDSFGIKVSPTSLINSNVTLDYIKSPTDPYWGYTVNGSNGSYGFNAAASTDFDLHVADEVDLTIKILSYVGVIIKDPTVIQAANSEETKIIQLEN